MWRSPGGVLDYLRLNWWGGLRQAGIADLLVGDTPFWRWRGGNALNGALWTLAYEIFFYLVVAVLAALTILRRQLRWLPLIALVVLFGVLCWNYYQQVTGGQGAIWTTGDIGPLPLFGALQRSYILWFGFMFLTGWVAELYSERLPISDLLGVLALAVIGWFAYHGVVFGPGLLAYAYVMIWLAVRLPKALHRVGRVNDYSYGVYIYSAVVQQVMAKAGVQAIGFVGFFLVSALVSTGFAMLSWHLVQKPALRLKDWTPTMLRERPDNPGPPKADRPIADVRDESAAAPPAASGASDIVRDPAAAPAAV
ncbi:acyltransferase family protein [Micromonospora sp. NBC_01796]|uniref:acyltransferase family protein n=1 Tax=Micromonospora sp. NBC_01796 TaxID=2975987 RepID=UPI002DDC0A58|nr:acyltransferase family protein [Micromonospora sp. NBC_01796]WSA82877.1 acyltransferase family protein [Micromonospora sp. NBC_01796]